MRHQELRDNLAAVRSRIESAAVKAGRDPAGIHLVVVTKFFPASDVRLLADLGVTDVGENRQQEAEAKAAECADLDLRWHFIGGLQSNKAAAVAGFADVVQSVDRAKLLAGLSRGAQRLGKTLDCLVQVSLDSLEGPGADQRSGASPLDAVELAGCIRDTEGLRLRGVMAVAPLGEDPGPAFARLRRTAEQVQAVVPEATWVSAGMSLDLEAAIFHGATHVRIGSAILGNRPAIK